MMKQSQYSDTDSQKKLNSMLSGLNKQKTLAEDEMTKRLKAALDRCRATSRRFPLPMQMSVTD